LIAHVSAIFLLPVFEKSVIFSDFRVVAHSISAREGGNMVCWKAIARKRTVDNSVTYWFPWKHPMARRRGLKFGVFDETPREWARRLGPMGLTARSSFLHKTTIAKTSARPIRPRHSPLSAPLHKNTREMWARPYGPRLSSVANALGANSPPLDVRLAVSDMLRSTTTTPSV